jgi:hypothetical protein
VPERAQVADKVPSWPWLNQHDRSCEASPAQSRNKLIDPFNLNDEPILFIAEGWES